MCISSFLAAVHVTKICSVPYAYSVVDCKRRDFLEARRTGDGLYVTYLTYVRAQSSLTPGLNPSIDNKVQPTDLVVFYFHTGRVRRCDSGELEP